MGYQSPIVEPTELRAGDTWQWCRSLSDYPASTWSLSYKFRNATSHFDVAAAADGDAFAILVPMATTAGYAAGSYIWYAFVENGTERYQVDDGSIQVLPDVSSAVAYDGRGWARTMLDYVDAALLGRASAGQLDVINATASDRGVTRDRAGLIKLRSQFKIEAKREAGESGARRILVRFG